MAYVISDSCVMCGACAGGCPVGAISEGDAQYQIDADACIVHVLQVLSQRLNHIFESLLAHSELRTLKELLLRQQLFFIQMHENARFHFLLLITSIACKPPQPYFSQAASRIH